MISHQQSIRRDYGKSHLSLAENHLARVCKQSSVVRQTISKYGDASIKEYLRKRFQKAEVSYQPRNDLLEAVYRYAAPLLGETTAIQTCIELEKWPVVLTANHHGIDFFAQSVQGSLLFALSNAGCGFSKRTALVFSFGNVSFNNLTYPRGMLIYKIDNNHTDDIPIRFPIFPDRFKRKTVSVSNAFDVAMINRAKKSLETITLEQNLSSTIANSINQIIDEDYSSHAVMELPDYSRQAVIVNSRIWKRLFADCAIAPELVYLEIEKIVALLLESDLRNKDSLISQIMFDRLLRNRVLDELDGARACWHRRMLARRFHIGQYEKDCKHLPINCGTVFFWGVDEKQRRIPLNFEGADGTAGKLYGIDDSGQTWQLQFSPEALIRGLQEGSLLPSLFTCFLVISLARGVTCAGGYYQSEYLPFMQRAVVNALRESRDFENVADIVEQVPTHNYLSGMQTVMCELGKSRLVPAGPLEIIAGGGLTKGDIEQILSGTIRDAHVASLIDTLPDFIPAIDRDIPGWKKHLIDEYKAVLAGKVIIK